MDQVTPADLARDLGIDPRTVRRILRAEFGKLVPPTTRWILTDEQIQHVRQTLKR